MYDKMLLPCHYCQLDPPLASRIVTDPSSLPNESAMSSQSDLPLTQTHFGILKSTYSAHFQLCVLCDFAIIALRDFTSSAAHPRSEMSRFSLSRFEQTFFRMPNTRFE